MFDLTALPLDIYRRNPFRLLGLDPFARRRDIRRRLTDFLSYVELNDTDALRSEVQGGFTALPDEARPPPPWKTLASALSMSCSGSTLRMEETQGHQAH